MKISKTCTSAIPDNIGRKPQIYFKKHFNSIVRLLGTVILHKTLTQSYCNKNVCQNHILNVVYFQSNILPSVLQKMRVKLPFCFDQNFKKCCFANYLIQSFWI